MTKSELQALLNVAEEFVAKQAGPAFYICNLLYRNKKQAYFDDIFHCKQGIMRKFVKDYHGDKACPINGRITGLYFGTSCDPKTGLPPMRSMYGSTRLNISPDWLCNFNSNLYFCDFYCIKQAHYVTIVTTMKGSESDILCQSLLLQLDPLCNPFFKVVQQQPNSSQFCFQVTQRVWVEIYHTEDINLSYALHCGKATMMTVPTVGTPKFGGQSKNPNCKACNLPLYKRDEMPFF